MMYVEMIDVCRLAWFTMMCFAISVINCNAAGDDVVYIPGCELTLIGKVMDTADRYARVDTLRYGGFTDFQRRVLNQQTTGLALVFKTNSDRILVKMDYRRRVHHPNITDIASSGCDLYIRRDGHWVYAGSGVPSEDGDPAVLVSDMSPGEKECLLYLPILAIIDEIYVGIQSGTRISAIANPFRHRIVFHGSSVTHGISANRPGMSYPSQFQRSTGYDVLSLGVSGNCKLQQCYARVLADTDADAFVLDVFSNPDVRNIRHRFSSFLETVRAKHPVTPIIFQQTIYRGGRNFNTDLDAKESEKITVAEQLVRQAMESDQNIYYIIPVTDQDGESSTDKTHPSDLGYYNWMRSIRQPVIDILSKYDLKPIYDEVSYK